MAHTLQVKQDETVAKQTSAQDADGKKVVVEGPKKKHAKKRWLIPTSIAVLLMVGAAIWWLHPGTRKPVSEKAALVEQYRRAAEQGDADAQRALKRLDM